jgi:hypothetical protein
MLLPINFDGVPFGCPQMLDLLGQVRFFDGEHVRLIL